MPLGCPWKGTEQTSDGLSDGPVGLLAKHSKPVLLSLSPPTFNYFDITHLLMTDFNILLPYTTFC